MPQSSLRRPSRTGTSSCPCAEGYADCNADPSDGCETPLGTSSDCVSCGVAGPFDCYPDGDGDGYTGTVAPLLTGQCSCPPGMIIGAGKGGQDCDDNDANVHPGELAYFALPSKSGTFDYNCDGVLETDPQVSAGACADGCTGYSWVGAVPACGAMGMIASCGPNPNGMSCTLSAPFPGAQYCH